MENLKFTIICSNLAVPTVVPENLIIFYPHIWVHRAFSSSGCGPSLAADAWLVAWNTRLNTLVPQPIVQIRITMSGIRQTFVCWLRGLTCPPSSNDAWLLGFRILQDLFLQTVVVEYEKAEVETIWGKISAKPAVIDYGAALAGVKRRQQH